MQTGTAHLALPGKTHPARWSLESLAMLWGRLRHRDPAAYEAWLCERDLTSIIAALLRLNDRQLKRIGMTRSTLGLDVEMLFLEVERRQRVGADVLELVADAAPRDMQSPANEDSAPPRQRIVAAE